MLQYIATPPAQRLDDDDTVDDVVASRLRLAVLRYDFSCYCDIVMPVQRLINQES
jgi:hypothetical protein